MKKIAVFTITCNRLELTKQYLGELKAKAGYPFEHIIVDNGSTDGTVEWLHEQGYIVLSLKKNCGILHAMKIAIKYALDKYDPDYIIKFDNDCAIHSKDVLKGIMNFYKGCDSYVVAPIDIAIPPDYVPHCFSEHKEKGHNVRFVTHVGGMFKVMPKRIAKTILKFDDKIITGDNNRGATWRKECKVDIAYLMDLEIEHMGIDNQTKNYNLG